MKKVLLIFTFYFLTCGKSFAYLDPGTGSIILQALIAILAAGAAILSGFWNKIKEICLKILPRKRREKINKN